MLRCPLLQRFLGGQSLGLLPLPTPAEVAAIPMPALPRLVDQHGRPYEDLAAHLQVRSLLADAVQRVLQATERSRPHRAAGGSPAGLQRSWASCWSSRQQACLAVLGRSCCLSWPAVPNHVISLVDALCCHPA